MLINNVKTLLSQTGVKLQCPSARLRMCSTVVSFDSNSHISPSIDPSALYMCVGGIYVVPALQ